MFQRKYPQFFVLALLLMAMVPKSDVHAQFVDVASSVGLTTAHTGNPADMGVGSGGAWLDYDNDGDLDLYISMRTGANLLYENNGGTFTEVAAAAGVEDTAGDGGGVVAADFDNDGCKDLFLANTNEDTLFRNNCDGTFTDVTASSGLDVSGDRRGTSASVGDYDGDGLLDLYVAHHTPVPGSSVPDDKTKDQDYLFHNDGSFVFTDVSDDMLGSSEREDASFIGAWTDFDNDGDLDIYLIRDCGFDGSGAMDLWRNDGGTDGVTDWTFTEVASSVNGNWCQNGMGVAVGDYDRNGYMDLFYTDNGVAPGGTDPNRAGTILLANSATGYTDMTDVAGVGTVHFSWGANFFDFDLDGYLDIFMAGGSVNEVDPLKNPPSQLWQSNGASFTYTNVSTAQGVDVVGRGRNSLYADYDQDGDPDMLLISYGSDVRLFRNDNGAGNNWLIVDLQGVTSNRDGVGARIELTSAGGTQIHEVRSGSSLGGGDDIGAYFGVGTDGSVTSLEITWPSGTVQTLNNVSVNQRITVVESSVGSGGLFSDVSASAGVDVTHGGATDGDMPIGTGAAWFDYDNDGDEDLYMTNREGANWLFENNGGSFTDVAAAAGVQDASGTGSGVAAADFNNDGCVDLMLANTHEDVLFENNCNGTFTDITTGSGLEATEGRRGTSASWGDYDNDGFLDLYIANHMPAPAATTTGDAEQDYLFRNNGGNGTFTDVSDDLLGADRIGRSFIAGWTDYDNDGDIDLYTIRDCPFGANSGPMRLYRNDGGTNGITDWTFTEVAGSVGADWCQNGMGLAVGDYNRDGWMDFFFTDNGADTAEHPGSPNRVGSVLLRNDLGTFTETTDAAGVDNSQFSWGANFFDFNNDMFQDLYMVAGGMDPLVDHEGILWENDGDGTFTDVSAGSGGINDPLNTRTSAYSDYDGDGDLDMFLVNYGQQAKLFRNDNSNGNNWVAIDLQGVTSNRDGIGAKIELTTNDGVTQYFEVRSGSSLGAGDSRTAFFGLGVNFVISDVTVRWPSGSVQSVSGLGINQRHLIIEENTGESSTLSVAPTSVDFGQIEEGFTSAPVQLTMTNDGDDAIDVTSVSITGTDAGDFNHTFAGPVTIAGGATSTFDVSFAPMTQVDTAPLLPEGVLYRVNAGGALVDDWEEDSDASPSTYLLTGSANIETDAAAVTLDASVPGGTPTDLFTTKRIDANQADPKMEWDFPVTADEEIEVRIYFVEMSRCVAANRLFDVQIEGNTVLSSFDVFTEAGGACNTGIMRSFTVTPTDSNLDIDFPLVNGRPSIVAGFEILGGDSGSGASPRAAQLMIDHSGSNPSLNVDLSGEALPSAGGTGTLEASPLAVDFGQIEVGSSSSASTITVSNTGDGPLDVTGVTISGTNASDFSHTFSSTVTVPAGGSSTFDVTFTPAEGSGAEPDTRTATVTIDHTGGNGSQDVSLTGEALPAAGDGTLEATPLAVDFGQIEIGATSGASTITLTNTGDGPLDVTGVTVGGDNAGDFSHTFAGPVTVAAGGSSTFDVSFAPQELELGAPSAAVETTLYRVNAGGALVDDWEEDSDATPSTYLLAGSANIETDTEPVTLDASVPAGTPTDLFTTKRIDANQAEPLVEWDFPVTAGEELEVRLYFVEMSRCSVGNRVFDVNIEGTTVLSSLDVFAEAGSACNTGIMRSFTVTPADDNLDINFPLANGKPSVIAGVEIISNGGAVEPDTRTAQLTIEHSGVNESVNVDLTGEALPSTGGTGTLEASPLAVDFGQIEVGTSSDGSTITLSNTGSGPLDVTGVTVGGDDADDFSTTFSETVTIPAGGSSTFEVSFAPGEGSGAEPDTRTAQLTIEHSGDNESVNVDLTGEALPGAGGDGTLEVSPVAVDFGEVGTGSTSEASTITLSNTGDGPLDVTGVTVGGANAGDYSHTFSETVTIAAGGTSTFDVTFAPQEIPVDDAPEMLDPVTLFRVNAGGDAVDDWTEDTDATPSPYVLDGATTIETDTEPVTLDASVPAGTPTDLFTAKRRDANQADPKMEWDFPVTAGEELEVRIYFVEMSRCATANRLFDVQIEGTDVLNSFDVYTEAGGACNTGIMRSFTLTPEDDNLDIDFPLVNGRPSIVAGFEIIATNEGGGEEPDTRTAQLTIEHTGVNESQTVDLTGIAGEPTVGENELPVAAFTWSATDLAVDFTDASTDSDGTIDCYQWDFDDSDGIAFNTCDAGDALNASEVSFTYAAAGNYTVTLQVTDDQGGTATTTELVSVGDLTGPFLEDGGLLVMEAEHYFTNTEVNGDSWTESTAQAGFSGTSAMEIGPNDGSISAQANGAEMTYDADFTNLGTYYVWARVFAPAAADNSFHMGDNGSASAPKMNVETFGSWEWTNVDTKNNVVSVEINSAGVQPINVWMREDGLFIDKIVLTTDDTFVPTGTGPEESARSGGAEAATAKSGDDDFQIASEVIDIPTEYSLDGNYPNPFNPTTTIQFSLPEDASVTLEVYDATGRLVSTLINSQLSAGRYESIWNGRNDSGATVASGVYLYRLRAGTFVESKTMLLMK